MLCRGSIRIACDEDPHNPHHMQMLDQGALRSEMNNVAAAAPLRRPGSRIAVHPPPISTCRPPSLLLVHKVNIKLPPSSPFPGFPVPTARILAIAHPLRLKWKAQIIFTPTHSPTLCTPRHMVLGNERPGLLHPTVETTHRPFLQHVSPNSPLISRPPALRATSAIPAALRPAAAADGHCLVSPSPQCTGDALWLIQYNILYVVTKTGTRA
nr:hypothetical protein CFP56_11196 [Quercus suber]